MATLLLELSLTRVFSVVFYYHFAFLAISIALFGLGAGGVLSYFLTQTGRDLFFAIGVISTLDALAVVVSLLIVLRPMPDAGFWSLAAVYFASALPFLLSGISVSLAIASTIERVDRVYFFDLLGAAAGCLLLIPFLNVLGGPSTVITASVLFAASASVWFGLARSARGRALGVALALTLVVLVVVNTGTRWIDVRYAKGRSVGQEELVQWNSLSRIAVRNENGNRTIVIDGDATTGIANFDFSNLSDNQRRDLESMGPGFPYAIRPGAKTLIIGPGGGWDVSRALASGSRDVTGVEINPIIANTVMRQKYPHWSNRLYLRPDVHIEVEDGRSFVRRTPEKYQLIQATLVDTWASTAAGAYSLSENNLYTTDAFRDYLTHLTDDGILAFSRWGFDPPRESLRLIALGRAALERLGETRPDRHFIVVREGGKQALEGWGALDTVIISRKPLEPEDLERARQAIEKHRFELVYMPGASSRNPFADFLNSRNPRDFFRTYPYDVSPVSDDKPFFFYTVQPEDVLRFLRMESTARADFKINLAIPTLFSLVGVSLLATLITLVLPPLVMRKKISSGSGASRFLPYFLFLGAGYILVQVALIQKLVMFLGHPIYALNVVVFSMLVASGLGSYFSARWIAGKDSRLLAVLFGVAGAVTLMALITGPVTSAAVGWPLFARIVVTMGIVAPPAFLMGMPFPSGLTRLERWHSPAVRWAWSLNAAASVLGSAGAIFIALYLGLRATMLTGAIFYLLAWLTVRLTRRGAAITAA